MRIFNFLMLLSISLTFSCTAQDDSNIKLEGKWKVIDWTYITQGRSLNNDERAEMNEHVNDLILNFKEDQTFSTNKPKDFSFLENKKYILSDRNELLIDNDYYDFLIRDHNYFFLLHNIMFQIEKIEDYKNSKLKLKKLPATYTETSEIKNIECDDEEVYSMNDLDTPPKFKNVQFEENCLIDCLYTSLYSALNYYIDFSKVAEDTSFYIDFIIDKTGKICNVNIKAKYNVYKNNRQISSKETNESKDIEDAIVRGILGNQDLLEAGFKNEEKVNTKIELKLRLMSK
ncbi:MULTISPECIES: hypothetical protein [unclassified Algibacter]|uniref:hypothetical protein n=1 Tax=unclassified Algibacter TaxID=2615009 RepID=UPI00131AFA7B|nr:MULTISPECIES: hypothetical protein [unclassified Algibacter]MCL5128393.1 hypothetical protein [Algibacter sp. L4_22]